MLLTEYATALARIVDNYSLVSLTGVVYTGRDQTHRRLMALLVAVDIAKGK